MAEYLADITGSDAMEHEWGERYHGWYRTMKFNRDEKIALDGDYSQELKVYDYQYRFIIPARVEFSRGIVEDGKYGIISYSEPERLLGVFRYPQDDSGVFSAPISFKKTQEDVVNLTDEELRDLIGRKKVLTFEAFRIPFFGFQFFSIAAEEFSTMEKSAGDSITGSLRSSYESELAVRVREVKEKIVSLPDYLLILQNILDLRWKNEDEIRTMTNGIIHFGI